ncbi:MAG: helicase-associated domain-containing protein [Deltaproteobacteria bacterium]|nr:helicase-associated domain-containing protein [Deltaproteobacteria bacterium]
MTRPRIKAVTPEAALFRTDVEWPQDREPLLSLVGERDLPVLAERLRRLGQSVPGATKASIEAALRDPGLVARATDPKRGATTLALAVLAQHPAGMEKEHLQFELALLLDDDRRLADAAVASLHELGVVLAVDSRRGERLRVLPGVRPALAAATSGWLDALERRGGAPGTGEPLGMRIKTSPAHVLGLFLAYVGAHAPRLRSAAVGTELHSRDQARVLDALHHVVDRTLIPHIVTLAVRAGLARPTGARLSVAHDAPELLADRTGGFWRRLLVTAVTPRAFAAVLRLAREPGGGFVPETTLRRAIKTLHHTEQVLGGHPFPVDARGNEAGARADLDLLGNAPLFERGRTPDGAPALRLHPAVLAALRGGDPLPPDHRPDGHVGADHEVHVGPSAPPDLLACLGLFAEPRVLDTVSRFHVTPTSVSAGAARGVHPARMEAVLHALASRGVPDNVQRTLQDYGAPRGRAAFGRGLIIAFAEEADARRAAEDPEVASLLGEALTPTVFLVDTAREARARARLVELGLAVAEDTLMYAPPMRLPDDEDHLDGAEAPLGTRLAGQRQATLLAALTEVSVAPPLPPPQPGAQVLHALTGNAAMARMAATASAGPAVVPLRARRAPEQSASTPAAGALERAESEGRAVRLRYQPEAGGGTETMTVEVVERFDRAGTPMVRVRFPKNPQAQERVLRVSRIQVVEAAKTGEGRG